MNKSELQKLLDSNIPESVVEKREAWKNGPMLSYLSGAYVINRLNEVLGQGNWGYSIKSLNKVHEGTIGQYSGDVFTVSYITTLGFYAMIDGKGASFDEVGYGDGTDKKSQGKAHELATKESVTDALKRAAKNLGISMGLGLYYKSEEYIDETRIEIKKETKVNEETKQEVKQIPKPVESKPVAKQENKGVAQTATPTAKNPEKADTSPDTEASAKEARTKLARQSIKSFYAVLKAKSIVTEEVFKTKYLAGKKVDHLTDLEVSATLAQVKIDFKEVLSL